MNFLAQSLFTPGRIKEIARPQVKWWQYAGATTDFSFSYDVDGEIMEARLRVAGNHPGLVQLLRERIAEGGQGSVLYDPNKPQKPFLADRLLVREPR
jgi:hypothetical protein